MQRDGRIGVGWDAVRRLVPSAMYGLDGAWGNLGIVEVSTSLSPILSDAYI